jgi:creatinine amidohydrolase
MNLDERAWPELGPYLERESLALVPVGSTEQHGPHLPEGTDAIIAEGFAREAARRADVLCTPTIRVGVSPHHRQFPGTMWADAPAFRDYVESLTRNLTYHGIDRVIYVNAHGGNVEHLREVGRRLRDDGELYAIEWMWDESIGEEIEAAFETPGPHGGPKETSLVWHLEPDLVREDELEAARGGGRVEFSEATGRVHGARTFYDAVETSDNGVFGDQTDAGPEVGAELFDAATEQLVGLCEWLAERRFEALMPDDRVHDDRTRL